MVTLSFHVGQATICTNFPPETESLRSRAQRVLTAVGGDSSQASESRLVFIWLTPVTIPSYIEGDPNRAC